MCRDFGTAVSLFGCIQIEATFFTINVLLRWILLVLDFYLDANSIPPSKSTQVLIAVFIVRLSCEVQFHPWTIKVVILVLQPFVLGSISSLALRGMPCYLATSAPVFHGCLILCWLLFLKEQECWGEVLSLNHLIQKHLGRKTICLLSSIISWCSRGWVFLQPKST